VSAKSDFIEPTPMDILREDGTPAEAAPLEAGAPISGQDVEDRLDSLFGMADETGTLPASASGGWKAAPDASPDPSASRETGVFPPGSFGEGIAPEPAMEEPPARQEAVDEASAAGNAVSLDAETGSYRTEDLLAGDEEHVSGADIERRLDDLFNLGPEDTASVKAMPGAAARSTMPSKPAHEDARELPDFPSVEDAPPTLQMPKVPAAAAPTPPPVPAAGKTETDDIVLAPEFGNTTQFQTSDDLVTGQDVADKLEDLFGAEPVQEPRQGTRSMGIEEASDTSFQPQAEEFSGDLLSTESMLPSSLGGRHAPPVTGNDIEDRLDKLFQLDEVGEAGASIPVTYEEPPAFAETPAPAATAWGDAPQARGAMPAADDNDQTLLMKAYKEPDADAPPAGAAKVEETARLEDDAYASFSREAPPLDGSETMILSASEMTGRETGAFESAADTGAVEMVEGDDVVNRLDELFKDEDGADAFLAARSEPETRHEETPRPEQRRNPAPFAPASDEPEMLLPQVDPMMVDPDPLVTPETVVSGEDVSARLSELFQTPPLPLDMGEAVGDAVSELEPPPMEVPLFLDSEPQQSFHASDETLVDYKPAAPSASAASAGPGAPAQGSAKAGGDAPAGGARELAPMQDEEEGYPEEDEMPSAASAAGANVATVTLAEIYFQQGLREQALQIYRQLLEREPANDSVRKRIQEIEASKPEGDKGQGGDPRRPRPGLKVPKRKK
jgi:hypothetical protein